MASFTIGITTFSKRLDCITTLISQIRSFCSEDIILAINGDYKSPFNEDYRKDILTLCLKYNNIYPIFFLEMRGIAKLWNTMAIHSKNELLLMLNDDLQFRNSALFDKLKEINEEDVNYLYTINESFSHFFVTKKVLEELKYFDERFLGFGHEDGDFYYRHIEHFKKPITSIYLEGIANITSPIRDENVEREGTTKYSDFNRLFGFGKYGPKYKPAVTPEVICTFRPHMTKVLNDKEQYPYESFYRENKNNL
jgi:hypothetical protein